MDSRRGAVCCYSSVELRTSSCIDSDIAFRLPVLPCRRRGTEGGVASGRSNELQARAMRLGLSNRLARYSEAWSFSHWHLVSRELNLMFLDLLIERASRDVEPLRHAVYISHFFLQDFCDVALLNFEESQI